MSSEFQPSIQISRRVQKHTTYLWPRQMQEEESEFVHLGPRPDPYTVQWARILNDIIFIYM